MTIPKTTYIFSGRQGSLESLAPPPPPADLGLERAVDEIGEWDRAVYLDMVDTRLSPEQERGVGAPERVFPRQKNVLAVHWHPEHVPLAPISRRIEAMFPACGDKLIIPTQHNELLTLDGYAGAEVDCYASGFNRKVQLLLHFKAERVREASVLKSMLAHTFRYRSGQLFELMDSITRPEHEARLAEAVEETGASQNLVDLARFYTRRLMRLIEDHEDQTPPGMIKNKLVSEFILAQAARHPQSQVNRALLLVKAVKRLVKRDFPLSYFFRASEIIEEARALGGGVVIPHPEQFWPILLAEYDVDGYEVWNPQSREFTEFLIRALTQQNKRRRAGRRELLIFMGDDTHMSAKVKDPSRQERAKLMREIGLQEAWDDLAVRKSLSLASASRGGVIKRYRQRLA